MTTTAHIGTSALRLEGRAKLTGATLYTDDLKIDGLLHGVTVRSTVARGRITAIRFAEDIPWHEFVIVSARDIPGRNVVAHLIQDQPCLVDGVINHAEEAILLLAHPDRERLEEARTRITVEVEPLPPVLTIEDSLALAQVVWGRTTPSSGWTSPRGTRIPSGPGPPWCTRPPTAPAPRSSCTSSPTP